MASFIPSENLDEIIDAMGCPGEDIIRQCDRMQYVSQFLKRSRAKSHPERHIGASGDSNKPETSNDCAEGQISEVLLQQICRRMSSVKSLVVSQSGSYFRLFFLSLLLDVLKAFKTFGTSTTTSTLKNQNMPSSIYSTFQAASSLVIGILSSPEGDLGSPWLGSRSCCLKVFDIVRLLTADDSHSRWSNDNEAMDALCKCCEITFEARVLINSALEKNSLSSSPKCPSSSSRFICDDIDSDLNIYVVTLHLALLNQLLKYESLVTASNGETCDYERSTDLISGIRDNAVLLGRSVVEMVSSLGAANMLVQLAVNDKELISCLLDASEVELRLLHNSKLFGNSAAEHEYIAAVPLDGSSSAARHSRSDNRSTCWGNNEFYLQNQYLFSQLRDIGIGGISCFLMLISECIAFDTSLFLDYLCSPETSALKYLLRVTKQLLALAPPVPVPAVRSKRIRKVPLHTAPRNTELLGICLASLSVKNTMFRTAIRQPPAPPSTDGETRSVISWLASEKSTPLAVDADASSGGGLFSDESLWGLDVCPSQAVCPSEWLRRHSEELDDAGVDCEMISEQANADKVVVLYRKTLDFLKNLRKLISRLGNCEVSSAPFDCFFLVERLDKIILIL